MKLGNYKLAVEVKIVWNDFGTLDAYVVQQNIRGRNLIAGRQISKIETAQIEASRAIVPHVVKSWDIPQEL